jgi:uncharacterized protein
MRLSQWWVRHPNRTLQLYWWARHSCLALPVLLFAGLFVAGSVESAPPKGKDVKPRPANRLAQESSPYLRQHAHNPVDWYSWGSEAFAKAKKENKLVFLSIGYSSCHWCHVMERESFDNEEIAKLMNQYFVCIKVDREERPDVDHIYMTALHVVNEGRGGGWPLSMWLTADGKPVLGGTYWPPDDREMQGEKVRGFKSVMKIMYDWHKDKPDEVEKQSVAVAELTSQALIGTVRGIAVGDLNRELVTGVVDSLRESFDKEHGGFGSLERKFRGPKFPTPPYLRLLQHEAARSKSADLSQMVHFTLDKMALGGIYDHLGGGFARYTVERTWTVPHFEKMLYDNAQLLEAYAQAFTETKKPLYRRVLEETLAFVKRELTAPEGGFYSALDADSEGEEGRFYVWTEKDLTDVLAADEVALVKQIYSRDGKPNFEGKYFILLLPKPLEERAKELNLTDEKLTARLEPLRRKLLEARAKRERPFLDTKVLTAWNGQMIAGVALASMALEEKGPPSQRPHLPMAIRAADFVLKDLRTKDGRLLRTWSAVDGKPGEAKLNAYLDDYAYLVHGLLCLHDATGEKRWLDEAKTLTEVMIKHHHDEKVGGFYYTSHDHEKLFARAKDQYDGAQPSGNSLAARNLVRLWQKTGEDHYRALAEKTFKAFAATLRINGQSLTTMAEALSMYLDAQESRKPSPAPKELGGQPGGPQRSDSVVKVKATAEKPTADGKQAVTVTLTIDKGWHVYANPVGPEDLVAAQTTVAVSKTKPEDVQVEYPKGTEVEDNVVGKYRMYEGTVTIKATVRRGKEETGPLEVAVKFQACTKQQCLLPATVKVRVP